MRRLRLCLVSTDSGGRGSPSGPTTRLCRKAGRGLDEGARKRAGSGGVIPIVLAPEARPPGQKSPRMERRKASAGRILAVAGRG